AVQAGKQTWTPIFMWPSGDVGLDAVAPVYDQNGKLLGVLDTSLTLNGIGDFLQSLKVSPHGQTFIMERSGLLVASSTGQEVYTRSGDELNRLSAFDSKNPLVQSAARTLAQRLGKLTGINADEQFYFDLAGERQFTQVTPYRDPYGLDWLIVTVIPESDFMSQIEANNRNAALLIAASLLMSVILAAALTRWVTRPILQLNQSARALARGDWTHRTAIDRGDEVGELSRSFDDMAEQLQVSFASLKTSEEKYRALFENAVEGIFQSSPAGYFFSVNLAMARMYGYASPEQMVAAVRVIREQLYVDPARRDELQRILAEKGLVEDFEAAQYRQDGSIIWISTNTRAVRDADGKMLFFEGFVSDITERKRTQDALQSSEERFRALTEDSSDGIAVINARMENIYRSPSRKQILGYDASEPAGALETVHPDDLPLVRQALERLIRDPGVIVAMQVRLLHKDGSWRWADLKGKNLLAHPAVKGIVVNYSDVTERKRAEQQIQLSLERLNVLHSIDMAITANVEASVVLDILLAQVLRHFQVDAAAVWLLNEATGNVEYADGRGFKMPLREGAALRLGEGLAGQVAHDRRTLHIHNLAQSEQATASPFRAEERFVGYIGVPLVAKGQLRGVLELLHRVPLPLDPDSLGFVETLATQAAIAIEDMALFADLQRSNAELSLAYDTTLEGWSHALDLRDKETEGHTQRVTDGAVRLARAMGFGEAELVQVRRGGLLHDIGKIGIPDSILLKPGSLTPQEMDTMHTHPELAYNLLFPIAYLRPALDIPYCHHEKWDGTGYPRGLKGEEIPLVARIFAVIDVWDALRSDRPYRPAWPREQAIEYIRSQAGKYFDPQVVEMFLERMSADQ
ncbi:MAG: HD domain-containing phosphohydrolase, partial [Anaerolineae bacterium]